MTAKEFDNLVGFLREKESMGIVDIRYVRPRTSPCLWSEERCIVFFALAGYYRTLLRDTIQRTKPSREVFERVPDIMLASAGTEVRFRIYW